MELVIYPLSLSETSVTILKGRITSVQIVDAYGHTSYLELESTESFPSPAEITIRAHGSLEVVSGSPYTRR
jgi:hypothetical protein